MRCLAAESVEGASLPLEGIDDVHGGDRLPLGVLGVGNGVADHVLEEHLEHAAGLFVDEAGDTLHSATTSQTADGWLGDALDVVTQHFAVTLGASFAESLSSFAASGHDDGCCCWVETKQMPVESDHPLYIKKQPTEPSCRELRQSDRDRCCGRSELCNK
jgi:hypothetical protein